MTQMERMKFLVDKLNEYRYLYYNCNDPVAGPALAVMGFVVGAKASANKEKAYANLANAHTFEEEMKTVKVLCKGIRMRQICLNVFL